jgi:uncharacterized protein YecE (DUF72 family)
MTGHDAPKRIYIGCAGWSLARSEVPEGAGEGTQLERYSRLFRAVEIISSFHRSHRRATYERWAESVPETFRFSVKAPKTITHQKRLVDSGELLKKFIDEASGLGGKLGALLVQLPPSLEYQHDVVDGFFGLLRTMYDGVAVVEPRHKTWFVPDANRHLQKIGITRVAADPAVVPSAAEPGGAPGKVYFRLHGSPQVYSSSYTAAYLDALAFRLRAYARAGAAVWCIFDNTIKGASTTNALHLTRKIVLEAAALAER